MNDNEPLNGGALILVPDAIPAVSCVADALAIRDQAIAAAEAIEAVVDDLDQELAVDAIRELKRFSKWIEDGRKMIKEPVLILDRRIDGLAREIVAPIGPQEKRLQHMVNGYQFEIRRKQEEAWQAREAELRRLEQERIAAELAAAKAAQEARRQAEALLLEEKAALTKAQVEASAQAAARAEAAAKEAERARMEANVNLAVPQAPKPTGTSVQDVWRWECTDVHALYYARPDLVRLEASAKAIQDALRAGLRECAGLRIWQEVAVRVRAA